MADKKVSELALAEQITSSDLLVLEQNNTAKKLTGKVLQDLITKTADTAVQAATQTAMEAQALAMHKVSTNAEIDSVLTNELTAMPLRSYKVVCLSVDKTGLDLIGGTYHVTLYKHDSNYWHCDATKYSSAVVIKASRSYYNGSWGKWGYSSPPMAIGVEYPTDQIWDGGVVYTTVIDCGTWAAGGAINTNITCNRIIEYRGAVGIHCLPFGSSNDANDAKIGVFNNSGKIRIGMIGGSGLTSNDTLIQLFYTKP